MGRSSKALILPLRRTFTHKGWSAEEVEIVYQAFAKHWQSIKENLGRSLPAEVPSDLTKPAEVSIQRTGSEVAPLSGPSHVGYRASSTPNNDDRNEHEL